MMTSRQRTATQSRSIRSCEHGFTLIEALIAVVILVFGLVAVAQLLAVAASSNSTANKTSATVAAASHELERLQTVPFTTLVNNSIGGSLNVAAGCTAGYKVDQQIDGVGTVRTCWQIQATTNTPATPNTLLFITVRSQVLGAFSDLTRSEFSTFRALNGTPTPTPTPCPTGGC